jgi:hypothetical protein
VRGDRVFKDKQRYASAAIMATMALISLLFAPYVANSAPINKHAVAVIIGNTNYQSRIPKVEFAGNDADAFKKFVIDVQGYDPENIIDLRDATQAQLLTTFGNHQTHEGKLWRYIDPRGRSDVTVFYSGHGVPSLREKRGYLLPVDADVETPEINGFSLDTLLGNLGKLKTKSVTVFLDACFSGDSHKGMLVRAASGITIAPKIPNSSSSMTIITAAQGDQVASWDLKARHGLFTKHLLNALYGNADRDEYGNGDGKVELGEVREYLDDRMTRAARRQFGRNQNVWARGDVSNILSYRPKGTGKYSSIYPESQANKLPKQKKVTSIRPTESQPTKTRLSSIRRPRVGSSLHYSNRSLHIMEYKDNIAIVRGPNGVESLFMGMVRVNYSSGDLGNFDVRITSGELRKAASILPLRVGKTVEFELTQDAVRSTRFIWVKLSVRQMNVIDFLGKRLEVWTIDKEAGQIGLRDTSRRTYKYSPALGFSISVKAGNNSYLRSDRHSYTLKSFPSDSIANE